MENADKGEGREGKCKPGSNEVSRQEDYMLAVTLADANPVMEHWVGG